MAEDNDYEWDEKTYEEQLKIDKENEEKAIDKKRKSINLRLSKSTDWKMNGRVKWPQELDNEREAQINSFQSNVLRSTEEYAKKVENRNPELINLKK